MAAIRVEGKPLQYCSGEGLILTCYPNYGHNSYSESRGFFSPGFPNSDHFNIKTCPSHGRNKVPVSYQCWISYTYISPLMLNFLLIAKYFTHLLILCSMFDAFLFLT